MKLVSLGTGFLNFQCFDGGVASPNVIARTRPESGLVFRTHTRHSLGGGQRPGTDVGLKHTLYQGDLCLSPASFAC